MKVLHLTLKKKWFDMIASGEKKEEYREIKDYWCKRFCTKEWPVYYIEVLEQAINRHFDFIEFRNGYSKNAPTIRVRCLGITVGVGNRSWGAPESECFIIKLGEIVKPS